MPAPESAWNRARQALHLWLAERWSEARHCRGCSLAVNPLDRVCPHCGQNDPALVSLNVVAAILLGAVAIASGAYVLSGWV